MKRHICIHGHFYQPPRENPWIEEVEQQDSAYPYHDWNERITAECYAPNAASRILDRQGNITDIVNNYSTISFNFGPTLLSWMQRHKPDVYSAILAADRESLTNFSGHGSAMAQVYNHMIMPLATSRDKYTQVRWGLRDFEHRFQRRPEGMWLAETAVDLETLDIMAEQGIVFTVLAPHQARRIRKTGEAAWLDVNGQKINPRIPYVCRLPSGRSIAIFFYDGPISLDVSFRDLLSDGVGFANRLTNAFSGADEPEMVHIATDGETYGHHHRYGEMALTYCLHHITSNNLARITVYGEFLKHYPPACEVDIFQNSSWSCAHGVERWRSDCGCNVGTGAGWNQKWRGPLREAMDWLRNTLIPLYERGTAALLVDPWKARDDYIDVILDRSNDSLDRFFARHAARSLAGPEKVRILKHLEMQRNAMLMYTSCGWFFDDIDGLEAVQVLSYAANALHTAQELYGKDLESHYLSIIARARSNKAAGFTGEDVYRKYVRPAVADLTRVGAHFAVSSLFEEYPETLNLFCYTAQSRAYEIKEAGSQRLAVGITTIKSSITRDTRDIGFAILHLGDHNIIGGIRPLPEEGFFEAMKSAIDAAFMKSDIAAIIRLIEKHFGTSNYSLWHLFRDEQRKVISQVLTATLQEREASFRQAYRQSYPIMQVMESMAIPLPKSIHMTADFTLNTDLRKSIEADATNTDELENIIAEVHRWDVSVDIKTISYIATKKINALMSALLQRPDDAGLLQTLIRLLKILAPLKLDLNVWEAQNIYFAISWSALKGMQEKSRAGSHQARNWIEEFDTLGQLLHVRKPKQS